MTHQAGQSSKGSGKEDPSKEWSMMRVCAPLDKIHIEGISEYHSFATLVSLDISLTDANPEPDPSPPVDEGANRRKFSVKDSLPFIKSRNSSPASSRDSSPSRTPDNTFRRPSARSPVSREASQKSVQYLNSSLPPRMSLLGNPTAIDEDVLDEWKTSYRFNLAVLNEQSWFAEAVRAAVDAAHERTYKPDATKPRMIMSIAGHDCLAMDDEIQQNVFERTASTSGVEPDDDEPPAGGSISHEMRKAAKASVAAKVFGLNENEGIWREFSLQSSNIC
jgi:sterol 3beta-glucosyltransferase